MSVPTSTADFRNDNEKQFLADMKLFDDIENLESNLMTTTELVPTTTTNAFYESFTFTIAETLFPFSAVYENFDDSLQAKTESSLLYDSLKKSGDSSTNGKWNLLMYRLLQKPFSRCKTDKQSITSIQTTSSKCHYSISATGKCYFIGYLVRIASYWNKS